MNWPSPLPPWMDWAFRYIGLREIPGKKHNPTIIRWLKNLKAWWSDDETPWCGTFVAEAFRQAGIPTIVHWYRAKAWAEFGVAVVKNAKTIPFGSVAIKSRQGGGHVFFPVARSEDGLTIYGLGANQSNKVSIVPFPLKDIDSIRFPSGNYRQTPLPIATAKEVGAVNAGSEA